MKKQCSSLIICQMDFKYIRTVLSGIFPLTCAWFEEMFVRGCATPVTVLI